MPKGQHVPNRPFWDCACCARPWPCDPAREELVSDFRGFSATLGMYMGTQHGHAMQDFMDALTPIPADLYERFLSWVRQGAASTKVNTTGAPRSVRTADPDRGGPVSDSRNG